MKVEEFLEQVSIVADSPTPYKTSIELPVEVKTWGNWSLGKIKNLKHPDIPPKLLVTLKSHLRMKNIVSFQIEQTIYFLDVETGKIASVVLPEGGMLE